MFDSFGGSFRLGKRPGVITDPTKLVNLQVWYDASVSNTTNFGTAPTNGSDVTAWKDKSGTGHDANQSGNNTVKPNWYSNVQNGLGVLRFNGSSESLNINPVAFMTNNGNGLSGFTLMIVAKASSLTAASNLTSTDTGGFRFYHNGTNWGAATSGGVGISTLTGDTTKFHIFSLIFDGTQTGNANRLKFRYDGVEQAMTFTGTVGNLTATNAKTFYVAADSTGGSNYFNGDIGEMLMFTRTLNTQDTLNTEAYLKYRWAL